MVPPVVVSPVIKFCRYAALTVGVVYGKKRYGTYRITPTSFMNDVQKWKYRGPHDPYSSTFNQRRTSGDYLKPIAEEERRIEAEEKVRRDEAERIAKELAAANEDTILK